MGSHTYSKTPPSLRGWLSNVPPARAVGYKEALEAVATASDMPVEEVKVLAERIFEQIIEQLCQGKVINIPKFGAFAPYAQSATRKGKDLAIRYPPHVEIRYRPHKGAHAQVMLRCPVRMVVNYMFTTYASNNTNNAALREANKLVKTGKAKHNPELDGIDRYKKKRT
jgi:nucleoid DNA-binding protein